MNRKEPVLRIAAGLAMIIALSLSLEGPAHAAGAIALPDPSGVTLFTLGVTGLAIGRYFAAKRKD